MVVLIHQGAIAVIITCFIFANIFVGAFIVPTTLLLSQRTSGLTHRATAAPTKTTTTMSSSSKGAKDGPRVREEGQKRTPKEIVGKSSHPKEMHLVIFPSFDLNVSKSMSYPSCPRALPYQTRTLYVWCLSRLYVRTATKTTGT